MPASSGRKPCITLIGAPGCGKTTLSYALAGIYGLKIADLDREIESMEGCPVSDIFAAKGESFFRTLETATLSALLDSDYDIISCGGGTPCFGDNMRLLNERSLTVYLRCGVERLTERLCLYGASRPLIAGKSRDSIELYVRNLLREREPFYNLAGKSFDSSRLETEEEIKTSASEFFINIIKPLIPNDPPSPHTS